MQAWLRHSKLAFKAVRRHKHALLFTMAGTGAAGLATVLKAPVLAEAMAEEKIEAKSAKIEPSLAQKCLAEVVGTGLLMHFGCGCVSALKYANYALSPFGCSAVWGATVMLAVYSTQDIGGAHINPAITASLAVNKPDEFPMAHVPYYWGSQLLGSTLACGLNYALFKEGIKALELKEGIIRGTPASTSIYNGAFGLIPNTNLIRGPLALLGVEIWCTSMLGFMVFALTDPDNEVPKIAAPVLIGSTVMTLVNTFGPLSGCGMNPARDIGPRIVTSLTGWGKVSWAHAPAYTVGPLIGAVLGGAAYNQFKKSTTAAKA